MAFDREAARQAGYSDAEIDAYLREERNKKRSPAPTTTAEEVGEPPAPTTVVPEAGGGVAGAATTAGLGVAPYVVPAAGAAAAALGGKALYNRWDQSAKAAQALADAKMASEQGIAAREAARQAARAGIPTGPVAPAAPSPILDAAGRPMMPTTPGPVAPAAPAPTMAPAAAAPAQAAEASLLDKTSAMIRQLAASKVLQNVAKGGVGLGAAMYSPSTGPAVPSTGRMKGMEINPVTGRPWTPEQIQQYEANPSMYDAQLGAPQFR